MRASPVFRLVVCAATFVAWPLGAHCAADATAVLKRASAAMGEAGLDSIRYAGNGTAAAFGQAYKPGTAWPQQNLSSYARLVDYRNAAFREDIVRSRAEPRGGGALPLTGEQRLSQFVSGQYAWNQAGPAPIPGQRFVAARSHELWITPHGVLKAAARAGASVEWRMRGAREFAAVSFTVPGVFKATAFINDQYLVERVESRVPDTVLGETTVETSYEDYRDHGGVRFPARIRQTQGGYPVLDLRVAEVQPNAKAEIPVPAPVRDSAETVRVEEAAPGVWYVAGGSHHSVAIEMKDYLIVVESPLYDGRAAPMLEAVRKLAPGKPIRYVIASHSHFDHAGGLRTAAAEGITIIAQGSARDYFRRVLGQANRIAPDRLAKSGRKPKVIGFGDRMVLSDGRRALEIYHVTGGPHVDNFMMAYLPRERLLIEADAYTPGLPNAAPPVPPNANNVNLVENIKRRKLVVERILPLHGRMVPAAEMFRWAGFER